ncbi:bacteriohemerythrin [Thermotalea metallivorans]|uniref:Bacteriohemerythrin n=1 Tax=Thermotalea metallivorans TaxID=520762 RepID=A0A140L962_9FIRM|nr:bacteriohemerythrin [Thermotalea metallivorans]KXG77087.1 Bacteriohemerythrin [Thermotalea metallivorans]
MFKWKDIFSCNVAEIDKQHQKLFELGTKLYQIISIKDGSDHYDEIMEVLEELKNYTIYHFQYEEQLMEQYGYEELALHKEEHKAFINKILALEAQDIDEEQRKVTMDLIVFISNWIEQHILKSDFRYKDCLNRQGVF